jgi:ABC-type polysaccharide/polyol phosphate transport system ATPase subunit
VSAAVVVQDVSLCYRLAKQRIPSLKEYAIHWMKGALTYEELWALRGVSLTLEPGDSLGIVGRNGAGKSTLLKVISRVIKPTRGSVSVHGTVAPILELGTGFDPELTGLENVYLNALLLGRTRREVHEKVDEIVEFSGLADFIRSPVRNYSTGMLARLGFSVATAWVPDVLILDEVLSVGDARFLRRCQRRLEEFRALGSTLLLVSHDVAAVQQSCAHAVWIEQGRVEASGPSAEVVERYLAFSAGA